MRARTITSIKPFDVDELRARINVGVRVVTLQEQAGDQRVVELQEALANVKQLHGLLPICSYCKRIRGDDQYWQQVESYIAARSDAQFSHGICPPCYEKLKSEIEEQRKKMRNAEDAMTGARPVFDREVVRASDRRRPRARRSRSCSMFLEDCPDRVAAIKTRRRAGRRAGALTAAHTLKGSAGYLAAALRRRRGRRSSSASDAKAGSRTPRPRWSQLEGAVARLVPEIERASLAS